MLSLLLALQFLGSVVSYYDIDNTIKVSSNKLNENSRSKRAVFIDGIAEDVKKHIENKSSAVANATENRSVRSTDRTLNPVQHHVSNDELRAVFIDGIAVEDVKKHIENERSAVANATENRSVKSTGRAQNRVQDNSSNDKFTDRSLPIATTAAANRWDNNNRIDIHLNRDKSSHVGPTEPKGEGDRWDITDILLNRAKPERNSPPSDPNEVSRISVSKTATSSLHKHADLIRQDSKNNLRWLLRDSENNGYSHLNNDEYRDFNVMQYLIKDYRNKYPEAKSLHQKNRKRNRYRRFNLNQDLLLKEPPKDIPLKALELFTESKEVPMAHQGSAEDLSVQPQPFEFTPLTDEEHQCTKAIDGIISEDRVPREFKMYLENDQSTGMVPIDTRQVCQQSTGVTVKACDKIRPYIFLIHKNQVEFDVIVVRIQNKERAPVTISVSCLD